MTDWKLCPRLYYCDNVNNKVRKRQEYG